MNLIENTVCVPIGNTPTKNDEKRENDIIETEMAGIKRREYNTCYHKQHAAELKIKRRQSFLKKQLEKLEKLQRSGKPFFTRKCPSCNIDLYHTNQRNLLEAIKSNRVCKHCAFKTGQKHPHNKGVYKRTESERRKLNRNYALKRNFGITDEEYSKMLISQGGKCKICNIHQNNLPKPLYVDHCHNSKKVRGLLCQKCNAGLGMFKENTNIMMTAIEYLKNQ